MTTRPTVAERLSQQEIDRREKAVRAAMKERNLDALLVSGMGPHFKLGHLRYLTNWCQPLFEEYYLFPLEGKSIYFSRYSLRQNVQSKALGLNARYPEYGVGLEAPGGEIVPGSLTANIPPTYVAEAIGDARIRRLGLCGPETMSADFYVGLVQELNKLQVSFEPASDLLWEIRMVRSPEEQEWERRSAAVGVIGFEAFRNAIAVGVREYEAFAEAERAQQLAGAERSFYMMAAGWEPLLKFPDMADHAYAPGDLVFFNTETAYAGYYTQVIRTLSVGEPEEEIRVAHIAAVAAKEAGAKQLIPGSRACDVFDAIREVARKNGYDISNHHPGHSQGLDIFEPPLISPYDTTTLKSGMLLTIHPGFRTKSGRKVWVGDSYLVQESGAEALSAADKDIVVVPVRERAVTR